jgi:SYF2 splicing factor
MALENRMLEIQLRVNEARQEHHALMVEAERREGTNNNSTDDRDKRWRKQNASRVEELHACEQRELCKSLMSSRNLDRSDAMLLSTCQAQAEHIYSEKRKKRERKFKNQMSVDEHDRNYRAYKRRLRDMSVDIRHWNEARDGPVPAERRRQCVDEMRAELQETNRRRFENAEKAVQRSRRDGTHVDYVNESNRRRNEAFERSYGEYAKPIVESFERRTAL